MSYDDSQEPLAGPPAFLHDSHPLGNMATSTEWKLPMRPAPTLVATTTAPLRRVPLQELDVSSSGFLVPDDDGKSRAPLCRRPMPSRGKENIPQAFHAAGEDPREYLRTTSYIHALDMRRTRRQIERDRARALARQQAMRAPLSRILIRHGLRFPFADHRPAAPPARLSMPEMSDDSGSEPDLSVLGMTRARPVDSAQRVREPEEYEEDVHDHLEGEDTSVEDNFHDVDDIDHEHEGDEGDEEAEEEEGGEGEAVEYQEELVDPASLGLKEISNLGRFTVSSHKQGNGVEELRSDDLSLYWQSDGPQPHKLTIYFIKRVGIRDLRFYVNYGEDESYTPTNIVFKSGTSENNLIEFAHLSLNNPVGWQQVPLNGTGGGPDGNTLVSYVLQMQILENHQNGKDTHLRGIKIYAYDADSGQAAGVESNPVEDVVELMGTRAARFDARGVVDDEKDNSRRLSGLARKLAETRIESGDVGFTIPDFMRDPEIR
ncbi:anaphase-promoting complex subunit 10 [Geosmithia morbida]|uniref:Anaphase-promoting complex subunit 10 n=1 Tax=Geosmithia morbida TaxID=1094350 RepID=A0A9P4Z0D4_9HYPO|nr:anaphase-promoting complex subunit 10 [Geosmithia morbida]KAF4126383.1 anaphase-promoting complex subunit 10 [Geosmithia morbida]